MLPDFSKVIPALEAGLKGIYDALTHVYAETKANREVAQSTQSILAFRDGVIDPRLYDGTRIAPRRITNLPVIIEGTTTSPIDVDVEGANSRQLVSAGFYRNIGTVPFLVTLTGVDGQHTAAHTLPAGATIPVSCLIARVTVTPDPSGPAHYQLYLQ